MGTIAPVTFNWKILNFLLKALDQVNEAPVDKKYVILIIEIEKNLIFLQIL